MTESIKIRVSTYLLGEPVRYDGGHKRNRYVTDIFSEFFQFVPVCPEVECGMPIPRESMRLVGDPKNPRLLTTKTKIDHTNQMTQWAKSRVKELEREELCGYIFKKDSPSSGLFRVKVYTEKGMPHKVDIGVWARAFTEHFPLIPVEEEGRLNDPHLRENFIERIITMKCWRETPAKRRSVGSIVDFHTRHKLLILSHSPNHYRAMGKLVATGKSLPIKELYATYETLLTEALRLRTTLKKNSNMLQHMLGYFKKQLTSDEKQELLEIIDDYRKGLVPLVVPVTLFNHFVRKYRQLYLAQQVYLRPHPVALKLRSHV